MGAILRTHPVRGEFSATPTEVLQQLHLRKTKAYLCTKSKSCKYSALLDYFSHQFYSVRFLRYPIKNTPRSILM